MLKLLFHQYQKKIAFTWQSHSGYFAYFEHRYMIFFLASVSSVRLIDTAFYNDWNSFSLKNFSTKFYCRLVILKCIRNSKNTESTDYESRVSILWWNYHVSAIYTISYDLSSKQWIAGLFSFSGLKRHIYFFELGWISSSSNMC